MIERLNNSCVCPTSLSIPAMYMCMIDLNATPIHTAPTHVTSSHGLLHHDIPHHDILLQCTLHLSSVLQSLCFVGRRFHHKADFFDGFVLVLGGIEYVIFARATKGGWSLPYLIAVFVCETESAEELSVSNFPLPSTKPAVWLSSRAG